MAPQSPRLARLQANVSAGDPTAVEQFWTEMKSNQTPLVEKLSNDNESSLVTFLWRGDADTRNVIVIGGPAGTEIGNNQMSRLPRTDVWYRTYKVRNDARFIYSLSPNDSLIPIESIDPKDREAMNRRLAELRPDPLNPRHDPGGMPSSYVELPEAPPQTWIEPLPGVPHGEVEKLTFSSAILQNERDVWVYTPPGFSAGERYPLLVMFDGAAYIGAAPTPVILDNLIAEKKIPPLVAAFVGNPTSSSRAVELGCSPGFADFLALELVPWMRKTYAASGDPRDVAAAGSSLGGLSAAYVVLRHPDVIGNAISQSGSFWWKPDDESEPEWLTRKYAAVANTGARLFLEAGLMEDGASLTGPSILEANRDLYQVLRKKGYTVEYREFNGDHDFLNWRGSLADGLRFIFGLELP